jgi:dTDP-4-dehydrorhamnose 3,5-epimerase-like enzyme
MKKTITNNKTIVTILKKIGNKDGFLSVIEDKDFKISFRRLYYIFGVKRGEIRGHHAHRLTKQFLICLSGSILITLDNGFKKTKVLLNSPVKMLLVPQLVWHTMEWKTTNAVLLVIASQLYNQNDYIRNFDEFIRLKEINNEN